MKSKILKWVLWISALVQISLWGITHLFFPEWYLVVIAHKPAGLTFDPNVLTIMNEIGGMTMALGIVTILASINPVKNINMIILLLLMGLFSISVTLYHILVIQFSEEWGHILTVLVQGIALAVLYPWKEGWQATYQ